MNDGVHAVAERTDRVKVAQIGLGEGLIGRVLGRAHVGEDKVVAVGVGGAKKAANVAGRTGQEHFAGHCGSLSGWLGLSRCDLTVGRQCLALAKCSSDYGIWFGQCQALSQHTLIS